MSAYRNTAFLSPLISTRRGYHIYACIYGTKIEVFGHTKQQARERFEAKLKEYEEQGLITIEELHAFDVPDDLEESGKSIGRIPGSTQKALKGANVGQ